MVGTNTTPRPTAPTSSLPPVARLSTYSTEKMKYALDNLRHLYWPPAPAPLPEKLSIPKRTLKHITHDDSVPDSGYASAEGEDDEDEDIEEAGVCEEDDTETDVLRADAFERGYALKWITSFVGRCAIWIEEAASDEEWDERSKLLEEATFILSLFNGSEEEEETSLTRTFSFPTGRGTIEAELNDAPLSSEDHTSVGLQSWGSSILLAERMCLDPARFSLVPSPSEAKPLRILELGAGTGLLSIVARKILCPSKPEIVATDYHPDVLANLRKNIHTNFPPANTSSTDIEVCALDWESPLYASPLDRTFDVILAADVVYHPQHAEWIKSCVEKLLSPNGVFWLIIPIRSTGRHEGMHCTVDALIPLLENAKGKDRELVVVSREEFGRKGSVGRADEGGYKLFEIGWSGRGCCAL